MDSTLEKIVEDRYFNNIFYFIILKRFIILISKYKDNYKK